MAIEIKKILDLSPQYQNLFTRAKTSITQHNYSYTFEILRNLLRSEPGCNEARKVLRVTQLDRMGGKVSATTKTLALLKTFFPIFVKGPMLIKKTKLVEALDLAEKAMEADPTSVSTLHFLARSAQLAGLTEVATEALELCARYNKKHAPTLQKLSEHYKEIGEPHKSLQALQQFCALKPNDLSLQNALKQATASAAMEQGKWNKAESFTDIVRDKDQAQTLEQQERIGVRDESTLTNLIAAAEKAVAEQPTTDNHKRLAALYHQSHDYEKALEQYDLVVEKMGTLDPSIDKAITEILAKRFDDAIAQWQTYAAEDPANREAEAEQNIAQIQTQKEETLFQKAKERVQRYPNDAAYRFGLGELYFARNEIDSAINEFQQAQRSPKHRKKSLIRMGKCMIAKGLTDMAIEQLTSALDDGDRMDNERKDVLYNLALLHDQQGQSDKALKYLKEIYASEANYLDVSSRIENYYQKTKAE